MRRRDKKGVSRREHLQAAANSGNALVTARAIEALQEPPRPPALEWLWGCFGKLDMMRGVGFSGPALLTPENIDAMNRLCRWELRPEEVLAIRDLDLAMHAEREEVKRDA